MDFSEAVDVIFDQEGTGTTDDKDDPGGKTTAGITAQTLEEAKQKGLVPHALLIEELTPDVAKDIYKAMYWQACKCDELPSALALATFDAAVNMGVGKAVGMLQQAVGTRIDGVVGPDTIKAAKTAPVDALDRMLASRAVNYADIVAMKPVMRRFFFGWLRRTFTIARLAAGA